MPKKLDSCVEKLMEEGKNKERAFAICQASLKDAHFDISFKDSVVYDQKTKTLISVRDGVQEYKGHELGLEPSDKVFKIYRSPEAIKNIVDIMAGLPITDDHVSLDEPPSNPVGQIDDSELIDSVDEATNSTVNIKNKVTLDFDTGNRQLSLGYRADLVDCDLYDFEQVDIVPHHLAIVSKGRCGDKCKFADKENGVMKPEEIKKLFLDEGEVVSMSKVFEIIGKLPELIKGVDIKEVAKLMPILQKLVAQVGNGSEGGEVMSPEDAETAQIGKEEAAATDAENAVKEEETEKNATADKAFADSLSAGIEKGVKAGTAEYAVIMAKAVDFLPDTYNFADKCACDIMRDALATEHKDKFEDAELPVAFKTLKKNKSYAQFADGANDLDKQLIEMGEKDM